MNSLERKQLRYERRNNKKLEKLNINIDEINQTKKAYKAYLLLGKK